VYSIHQGDDRVARITQEGVIMPLTYDDLIELYRKCRDEAKERYEKTGAMAYYEMIRIFNDKIRKLERSRDSGK